MEAERGGCSVLVQDQVLLPGGKEAERGGHSVLVQDQVSLQGGMEAEKGTCSVLWTGTMVAKMGWCLMLGSEIPDALLQALGLALLVRSHFAGKCCHCRHWVMSCLQAQRHE